MAQAVGAPGVEFFEKDLSLYAPSLADTPFGVVIASDWGPLNVATLITSQKQLFDTFGPLPGAVNYNPALANYPKAAGLYALDRYMRRGRRAIVVRVGKLSGNGKVAKSVGYLPGETTIRKPPTINNSLPVIADPTAMTTVTNATTGGVLPDGKYRVKITFSNSNGETKASDASPLQTMSGSSSDNKISVTPPAAQANATQYNVYLGYHATDDPLGNEVFYGSFTNFGDTAFDLTFLPAERRSNLYRATARHFGSYGDKIQLHVSRGSNWTLAAPTKKVRVYLKSTVSASIALAETFDGLTANASDALNDVLKRITPLTSSWVDLELIAPPGTGSGVGTVPSQAPQSPTGGSAGKLATGSYYVNYTYERAGGESEAPTAAQVSVTGPSGSISFATESSIPSDVLYIHAYISPVGGASADVRRVQTAAKPATGAVTFTLTGTADKQVLGDSPTTAPHVTLSGGVSGLPSTGEESIYVGTPTTSIDPPTGLEIFRNAEAIQVGLLAVPGIHHSSVVNALIDVASVSRGDCLALIDPPPDLSPDEVIKWHNGQLGTTGAPQVALNSSYAAVYWPYLLVNDSLNGQDIFLPPSGFAAEVIAFTDFIANPWFAPAGLFRGKLTNVKVAQYQPNKGDRIAMYSGGNAVNAITTFSGRGIAFWGQRTLQREPTALDRINVRRLLITVRRTLEAAIISLTFEPNDPTLWRKTINLVDPVLRAIKQGRGLIDYKIRMDASNNDTEVQEQSIANLDVFLKPTKAAEEIHVNLVVTRQDSTFSEDVTSGTI